MNINILLTAWDRALFVVSSLVFFRDCVLMTIYVLFLLLFLCLYGWVEYKTNNRPPGSQKDGCCFCLFSVVLEVGGFLSDGL